MFFWGGLKLDDLRKSKAEIQCIAALQAADRGGDEPSPVGWAEEY